MKVTIIGGGIIGLCTAYYLNKDGYEVSVVDQTDLKNGCSFGNMGYISPSHFLPLASPGIVKQGIKWMFDSSSPFYVKPRLDFSFMKWAWLFNKSANAKTMNGNAQHLNALLQMSRGLIKDMVSDLGNDCSLSEQGCFMLYKNEKTGHHEAAIAKTANAFGLITENCDQKKVQGYEPNVEVNVAGGVLYKDDCYVAPTQLMESLYRYLSSNGVQFFLNQEVIDVEKKLQKVTAIITAQQKIQTDYVVVANGSWMEKTAQRIGAYVPMQPGKGYSFTYNNLNKNLHYPSILVDHRVATTPYNSTLRMGGTMELSGHNNQRLEKRIYAIYESFKLYYPAMAIQKPDASKAWSGFRPVSPDGMPYIGQDKEVTNVAFAGGHAMLGVSAANATGKLIAEIVANKKTTIDLTAFNVNRF